MSLAQFLSKSLKIFHNYEMVVYIKRISIQRKSNLDVHKIHNSLRAVSRSVLP